MPSDASRSTQRIYLKIRKAAIEILETEKDGLRWSKLFDRLKAHLPTVNPNTILGELTEIRKGSVVEIYLPDTGLYRLTKYRDEAQSDLPSETASAPVFRQDGAPSIPEQAFYKPFATFLVEELGECTEAIELGHNFFGSKWQTPDVIGKWESSHRDVVTTNTTIVSAEIKLDENRAVEAFGQACSYKLFSHKVFLVIPRKTTIDDLARVKALCSIIGIGLVTFDANNVDNPDFVRLIPAQKSEPDMRVVNEYMNKAEMRRLIR